MTPEKIKDQIGVTIKNEYFEDRNFKTTNILVIRSSYFPGSFFIALLWNW
jgi:hypothetical protein